MQAGDQQEFMSRLAEDPDFRAELRDDPEGALERRGVQLSGEQREQLRELDAEVPDEQLAERVSKLLRSFSDARLKRAIQAI